MEYSHQYFFHHTTKITRTRTPSHFTNPSIHGHLSKNTRTPMKKMWTIKHRRVLSTWLAFWGRRVPSGGVRGASGKAGPSPPLKLFSTRINSEENTLITFLFFLHCITLFGSSHYLFASFLFFFLLFLFLYSFFLISSLSTSSFMLHSHFPRVFLPFFLLHFLNYFSHL